MKTIGLIGGMSWESTVSYYQIINRVVKRELGGLHSAQCLIYSVDFDEVEHLQTTGEWDKCGEILSGVAKKLEQAGAEAIILCTNTMHKVAGKIQENIRIPFLHIAEMTANALHQEGITNVALLGTRYTMEEDFYKKVLVDKGIQVLIPDATQRHEINRIIFEELCQGIIKESSKQYYLKTIEQLSKQGAQGVILGCTEIGLLVQQSDTPFRLFDTTQIHAEQGALFTLE